MFFWLLGALRKRASKKGIHLNSSCFTAIGSCSVKNGCR